MDDLHHIIYVSSASSLLSGEELSGLLTSFRERNALHDITGMLLYQDGNIMQVLEGRQAAVEGLFQNIQKDVRHSGVIVLIKEAIEQREFNDWSMSYRDLSGSAQEGFSNFMSIGSFEGDDAPLIGNAKKLLLSFRG